MKNSLPKLVVITGLDGTGKSTLVKELVCHITNSTALTIWDLMTSRDALPFLPFKSGTQVDLYLSVLSHKGRATFLFHCLHEALNLALLKKPEVILCDSWWYKYYATEAAHGCDPDFILSMADLFPKPDLVICLKLDNKSIISRKSTFSGYECGFSTERNLETFMNFRKKASIFFEELMDRIDPVYLDGRLTVEENTKKAYEVISFTKNKS